MSTIKIGDKAPDIKIGEKSLLEENKGKKIILYFYPKDNTPGCTAEACNLRDNYEILKQKGLVIYGVSPDSEKSHNNFKVKYNLPFELIADTNKEIVTKYGVWVEKTMYGKKYFGVQRTTFIIDENGYIEHIIDKVDTKNHAQQILEVLNL